MEESDKKLKIFQRLKHETLNRKDLSIKGSIDEPILPLVNIVNASPYYYTSSTCSGRITLIRKPTEKSGIKKGSDFLLTCHEHIKFDQLIDIYNSFISRQEDSSTLHDCLWLKFEPFIIHIQCFNLDRASKLLTTALAEGNRNSGITFGKHDKYMLAVRSTSSMEVPIYYGSEKILPDDYLRFLCDEANRRLTESTARLDRFQNSVEKLLKSA